jgi:hypothetical protein
MRFCKHVPNSPKDKNKMLHNPCQLKNVVILASKTLLFSIGTGGKTFSSTLNFMILQMVRNECVKFGGHVYKQVNYRSFKVPNNAQSTLLLIGGCFEALLPGNTPRTLGVDGFETLMY